MAGSITVTTSVAQTPLGMVSKYSIAWLSTAGGAVSANTFGVRAGELLQVAYIPDGGGTAPTDLYDVTMTDANGVDVLTGTGANLSGTLASVVTPAVSTSFRRYLEAGLLTPVVANAGSAKGGTIVLYIR